MKLSRSNLFKMVISVSFTTMMLSLFISMLLKSEKFLGKEQRQSILDKKIDSLSLEKGDMEEALGLLIQKEPSKILIGFESIPRREGEKEKNLSFNMTNLSIGEILSGLCKSDRRYTYELVDGSLIDVFPHGSKDDMTNLLNIRISKFTVQGRHHPHNIVRRIGEWAPELRDYLNARAKEYSKQTGIYPASIGALLTGNRNPEMHMELQNITVRELLNEIVRYSSKSFPTSWKYVFVIDGNAPTGLGGYPQWDVF